MFCASEVSRDFPLVLPGYIGQKKGLANTLVAALVMATFCCSSPHIWIVKCIHIVDTFTDVNFKDFLVAKYVHM